MSRPPRPADVLTERLRFPAVVSFLELAAAQLETAMQESEPPAAAIAAAVGALAAEGPALEQMLPGISTRLREAVIALQFYDRLAQRLTHTRDGLMLLAGALATPDSNEAGWRSLHERIRRQYSMEQERRIFALAAAGAAPEELWKALAARSPEAPDERVELF